MAIVQVQELIEAGVHFGHRASRWNPKMRPYIYGKRNLIHIIDLRQTLRGIIRATTFLQRLVAEGHQIDLHHQLVPLARQALESAQSSYAAGRGDFAMALESARELRMHELELAMHLAAYEQRLAELQRAVGAELGLDESADIGHDERH